MTFTRLLRVSGYLLAALCLFGIATQVVQFGHPLSQEHQQAVETWRKAFTDTLQSSHVPSEDSQRLASLYAQSIDERERLLGVASKFMAGACTIVVGLLSIITFLWHKIRVLKNDARNNALQATAAAPAGCD
jgi:hypothetical protein